MAPKKVTMSISVESEVEQVEMGFGAREPTLALMGLNLARTILISAIFGKDGMFAGPKNYNFELRTT